MSRPRVGPELSLLDRASAEEALQSVEISINGKCGHVPALHVNGNAVVVKGDG